MIALKKQNKIKKSFEKGEYFWTHQPQKPPLSFEIFGIGDIFQNLSRK